MIFKKLHLEVDGILPQPDPNYHLPQSNGENVVSLADFNVYDIYGPLRIFYGLDFAESYQFYA